MWTCALFLVSALAGGHCFFIPGRDGPQPYLVSPLLVADVEEQGWEMVFRATAGNGEDVYNAYVKGAGVTTQKPVDMGRSYASHYRNPRVDHWETMNIQYVKVALYKMSQEVAYMVFDGLNSNLTSWFDKTHLEASSWSDMTPQHDFNMFSIAGHVNTGLERTFFVNVHYGGCDADYGHMVVVERDGGCNWDHEPSYPTILYSDLNSADYWNRREFGRADYMAIYVNAKEQMGVIG